MSCQSSPIALPARTRTCIWARLKAWLQRRDLRVVPIMGRDSIPAPQRGERRMVVNGRVIIIRP